MKHFFAAAAALTLAASAQAGVISHTFQLGGLTSGSSFFATFPSIQHNFGVAGEVVSVEFDLTFTSHDPSWRSEAIVFVDGDADGLGDFEAWISGDYGAPDSPGVFSYADAFPVSIISDGVVSITLAESFDDNTVNPDATYAQGSFVTVYFNPVPAPGAMALLGGAGLIALRRRR